MNTRKKPNTLNVNVQSPNFASRVSETTVSNLTELSELFSSKLSGLENRLMERIGCIAAELSNIKKELLNTKKSLVEAETNLVIANDELKALRVRMNILENSAVASDAILYNVPDDVSAELVVDKLFDVLKCSSLKPVNAFRVRAKNRNVNSNNIINNIKSNNSPIIVKLRSADDRSKLFKAFAGHRKLLKRQLQYNDLGISGSSNVSLYECLSDNNRKIMSAALRLKYDKRLVSVFSLRGKVFVRVNTNDAAVCVPDLSRLEAMVVVSTNKL